jgi:methionyl aminopeptidase
LKAGRVSAVRDVPATIARPPYAWRDEVPARAPRPARRRPEEIAGIRRACEAASAVLAEVAAAITPGVTTEDLDRIGHEAAISRGGYPSPLGYRGFPKAICTSINEVICHGIPDTTALEDGDIISVDVTVFLDGYHGDLCQTFLVGDVDRPVRGLVAATRRALLAGMAAVRPGVPVRDIGAAIEAEVGDRYGIVREFVGHEIGPEFHGALIIPHYADPLARTLLEQGMVFTIEPMVTLGPPRSKIWSDGWTAVTAAGGPCAQFEHTVVVTTAGCEPLTSHVAVGT